MNALYVLTLDSHAILFHHHCVCAYILTGEAHETTQLGLLQEQVEYIRAGYHSAQLECLVCLYQENPSGEPWHGLLPDAQRPVSHSHTWETSFVPLIKERWCTGTWFCTSSLMWLCWHVHVVVSSFMHTVMCASNSFACYATDVSAHKRSHCAHNACKEGSFFLRSFSRFLSWWSREVFLALRML